jgi:hypothetical protein
LWAELDPIYQAQFVATALRFALVYGSFAGIPNANLREPSLLRLNLDVGDGLDAPPSGRNTGLR